MTAAVLAPLRDRRGHFAPLKAITFALLFAPGLWFAGLGLTGNLTPQPNGFIIYNSGVWAMWLLLLSLAVTPARRILGWNGLVAVRRMIGLAGLAYTLFHLAMYLALEKTTWATVSADLQRLTVLVALASTLGLTALAATSFDAAVQRLGSRTWNRIHNLTYPAIGLAMLHFDMGPESLGGTPFVMTGLYFWLIAWRGLNRFGRGTDVVALTALAVAVALATLAFEAGWLSLLRGYSATDVIAQLWSLDDGLAEAWQVLLVGLAAAGLAAIFARRSTVSGAMPRFVRYRSLQPT